MLRPRSALIAAIVILGGCLPTGQRVQEHDRMENPLFAKRYYDELVESLVSLTLHKDPILQKKGKEKIIERARHDALEKAERAEQKQRGAPQGTFIPMGEYTRGTALLLGKTLYLSPDFEGTPGLSLHLFLTTVVDPRDVTFPDPDAIDLGPLKSPYGAQEFPVRLPTNPAPPYRTAVLWDITLDRLIAFAQLSE